MANDCCDVQGKEPERLKLQAISTAVSLGAVLLGWVLPLLGAPAAGFAALIVAYAAAGWEAGLRALRALRAASLDVDVLMLTAAAGAAVVDHWLEGAILLFLFSLGNTLETFAFRRTRRSIEALVELRPDEAARVENGGERTVPLEELRHCREFLGAYLRGEPEPRDAAFTVAA